MYMRSSLVHALAKLFGVILLLSTTTAYSGEPWIRIDEEWELQVGQPDTALHSPQLTIYLTPSRSKSSTYFQLQLNHAADSHFLGGGLRVAAISDDQSVDDAVSDTRELISQSEDTIRWTNVMAVVDDELLFAIKEGTSQSWGQFGGPEYLLRMPKGDIEDFGTYTPRQSIADVDFGYGRNRIIKLKLKRVRAYRADGTFVQVDVELEPSS